MVGALMWLAGSWAMVNGSHVAAHLLTASFFGVAVNRVSLGFGPTLWSRTRGATTFRVALIPVAVLVRLRAPWKSGVEGVWPPTSGADLRSKRVAVRLAVFASAPAAILGLAFVFAYAANSYESTAPDERPVVSTVVPGKPAAIAGIRAEDVILALNGTAPKTWKDLAGLVATAGDGPLVVRVKRGDQELAFSITPEVSPIDNRRVIGIAPRVMTVPAPRPLARVGAAIGTMVRDYGLMFSGTTSILSGNKTETVGGPVLLYTNGANDRPTFWRMATDAMLRFLLWCVVLPYLDGRRLLFLGIEVMARKPLHPKYEQWFNRIWLGFLAVPSVLANVMELRQVLMM